MPQMVLLNMVGIVLSNLHLSLRLLHYIIYEDFPIKLVIMMFNDALALIVLYPCFGNVD